MLALEPVGSLVDAVTDQGAGQLDAAAIGALVTPIMPGLESVLPPVVPGDAARVGQSGGDERDTGRSRLRGDQ